MENMSLYGALREVPENAKKPIAAGRLKGFTNINDMWRIERMTEVFGPCGFGWWYEIKNKALKEGANGEIKAFVDIDLYVRYGGEVSAPIPGTGGSSFVANEKSGKYCSDECFKMALTDAISVATKMLGLGADIYRGAYDNKYGAMEAAQQSQAPRNARPQQQGYNNPSPQQWAPQGAVMPPPPGYLAR